MHLMLLLVSKSKLKLIKTHHFIILRICSVDPCSRGTLFAGTRAPESTENRMQTINAANKATCPSRGSEGMEGSAANEAGIGRAIFMTREEERSLIVPDEPVTAKSPDFLYAVYFASPMHPIPILQ